ncbi:hypothetical protein EDD37DRAFT_228482 [Exophiala viscosa]|uniref:uncharacterized protein n=1 Tax=Exophiala viscosa TaxID=2486360 RepID=UPI00219E3D85|nr:hypothetical protein EDD37DRAFT_228482 [Exophiala viscosa]
MPMEARAQPPTTKTLLAPKPCSAPTTTTRPTRKRISHACDRCRHLRAKCSGEDECSRCVKDGLSCYYGDRDREKNKKALGQALHRIKTLEKDNEELVDIVRSLATTSKASWQVRDYAINVLAEKSQDGIHQQQQKAQVLQPSGISPSSSHLDLRKNFRIRYAERNYPVRAPNLSPYSHLSLSDAVPCARYPIDVQAQQMDNFRLPEHYVQPLLSYEGESPMATAYISSRDSARQRLLSGESQDSIFGTEKVEVDLFFRAREVSDPHTPSTWASEYFRALHDIDTFVCLAGIFNFDRFMRWTIAPSAETYASIPPGQRPTPCQRLVPHHPASDLPVLPELRDGLIYDLRDYILASQSFGTTVNWHKGLETAVDINPTSGKMTLSATFVEHVWDLENWSFSGGFAAVFPELRRRYRILPGVSLPVTVVKVDDLLHKRETVLRNLQRQKS